MANPAFIFGFEHETGFLTPEDTFADHTNTDYAAFQAIVDRLPRYESDYPGLRVGDAKIKEKRWYVEGYERFDERGALATFVPKGIEVRSLPEPSIEQAVQAVARNFAPLAAVAAASGFEPVSIAYNPFHSSLRLDPPLNAFERRRMAQEPHERTGYLTVYTFGPDINLSTDAFSDEELVDIARKLTFWSPYLVPFSFFSPFRDGMLWGGYSARTYVRTGDRYAAKVFINDPALCIPGSSMVALARIPREYRRIEFKAFDAFPDFSFYGPLAALIKGIVLGDLPGRADVPDKALHQLAARQGFQNAMIAGGTKRALSAARAALAGDPDRHYLDRLEDMLARAFTPAQLLIAEFTKTGSIIEALRQSYEKFRF